MGHGIAAGVTLETRSKQRVGQAVDDVHQFICVSFGAAFAPKLENPKAPKHHRVDIAKTAVPGQVTSKSPMTAAMQRLMNPRGSHPHEFRILFALVNGHTDPEIVRALVGGCRRDFFEAAAIRAFSLVWDRAQEELGEGRE